MRADSSLVILFADLAKDLSERVSIDAVNFREARMYDLRRAQTWDHETSDSNWVKRFRSLIDLCFAMWGDDDDDDDDDGRCVGVNICDGFTDSDSSSWSSSMSTRVENIVRGSWDRCLYARSGFRGMTGKRKSRKAWMASFEYGTYARDLMRRWRFKATERLLLSVDDCLSGTRNLRFVEVLNLGSLAGQESDCPDVLLGERVTRDDADVIHESRVRGSKGNGSRGT